MVERALKALDGGRDREHDSVHISVKGKNVGPVIVGQSYAMRKILQLAERAAGNDLTVLIEGETGTGKTLLAEHIHFQSKRSGDGNKPLVVKNVAAIPETLLESELFGYEKGAFTDARTTRKGLFEDSKGSTILLDEIGDMPLATQAKLLTLLDQKEVVRLGSTKPIKVDVRLIAATNKNLKDMVAEGTFRQDLYYRIRQVAINIPPLRDPRRRSDIKLLAFFLRDRILTSTNRRSCNLDRQAIHKLMCHDWPGNVRELENVIAAAMAANPHARYLTDIHFASLSPSVSPAPTECVSGKEETETSDSGQTESTDKPPLFQDPYLDHLVAMGQIIKARVIERKDDALAGRYELKLEIQYKPESEEE